MKIPVSRLFAFAVVVFIGIAIAPPNFLPSSAVRALPDRPVALGLDLRGGVSLTLQVDEAALADDMLADTRVKIGDALQAGQMPASILVEGRDLVIRPQSAGDTGPGSRATVEKVLPTFRRGTVVAAEPAYMVSETQDGTLRLTLRPTAVEALQTNAVAQSIEVMRRRADEAGVAELSIQQLGTDRILVQMPGVSDPSALRTLLGSTAELTFHRLARDPGERQPLGLDALRLPMAEGSRSLVIETRSAIDVERLVDASTGFNLQTGAAVVHFRFDTEGALIFSELMQALVGQPFATALDGQALSAPVIREPILGRSGEISGDFKLEETNTLSVLLLNVVLTSAALGVLSAALTLPCIAGLIFSMGLAVDANVLINERSRKETARGQRVDSAVQSGFDRAYRAVLDSKLTTFIATAMLFWLGSGRVKGFAATMGPGILISLFRAIKVVWSAMDIYLRSRRPKTSEIRAPLGVLRSRAVAAFRFMRMRFAGLGLSFVLSAASVLLFVNPGLNYGVDVRGGILVEAHFTTAPDVANMRLSVEALGLGDVSLQQSDTGRSLLIRVEEQPGGEAAQTRAADNLRATIAEVARDASFERVEVVGPRVSAELAIAGILAVGAASLAMLIYIWARFDWPFAVGAIVTLALDITKTVGFFSLTGLDFGLTAIAALLTLIGYSVNDKVVVYDRMRENIGLHPDMPLRDLIDLSIDQTLARCFYTFVTALVAMLPMVIWGGAAVQSFAIPMVFSIAVAAGSSVFIAAPILLFLGDWRKRKSEMVDSNLAVGAQS